MIARRAVPLFAVVTLLASLLALGASRQIASAQQKAPQASTVQPQRDAKYFMVACVHDQLVNPSTYKCRSADSTASTMTFRGSDMESATFSVKLRDGRVFTQKIPAGTDAIALSDVALEKFWIPYYQRVGATEKVTDLKRFIRGLGALRTPALGSTPPAAR